MKKISIAFLLFLVTIPSYSQQPIQHLNSPFASIAIGYRRILGHSIDNSDRSSGAYRLALGYYFLEHKKMGLSAELGIMNDNRVKMEMLSNGDVPNMTLRPPIDLLFGVHAYYKNFMPFVKFGATYEQIRFDYPALSDQDGWLPTIQAGFGWLFNDHAEMNLYYQRTFGKNVSVEKVPECYYIVKDHLPSIAGIFLAFVWRLA